jgi:hypothetical protein
VNDDFFFRYFPDYKRWARFSTEECKCENNALCLQPAYFDDSNVKHPVCVTDLVKGNVRVRIPSRLQGQLKASLEGRYPQWTISEIEQAATTLIEELSRTPPVPWIQGNEWPILDGDFCRYLGEWNLQKWNELTIDGSGAELLWSSLEPSCHERRNDVDDILKEMEAGWTVIYVFESMSSQQMIAVDQSY